MTILRIEHKIGNYDDWKKAFDSDPINRKKSGVKRYRIYRAAGDDKFVTIDLEFDNSQQAEAVEKALKNILPNFEGNIIFGLQMKILNLTESSEL